MKYKPDTRTTIVLCFAFVVAVARMTISALTTFHLMPPPPLEGWSLLDRLASILNCAALAACGVLASVFFGIKHFASFSRLDKIFTHLPIGIFGLALVALASHTVLTKVYNYHRGLLDISDAALLLIGSFLCFWVFLYYGRKISGHAA